MTFNYRDLLPTDFTDETLRADVLAGLLAESKWLPPKWFYDKTGSALFEEITRLPEYYPTRCERSILRAHAAEMTEGASVLVELGSGSAEKAQLLLAGLSGYVAIDVSESALRQAGDELAHWRPDLVVEAVRADFETQLEAALSSSPAGRRVVAFLGGTIGNLAPGPRAEFLRSLADVLRSGDTLLLGADLVKPASVLVPAYDDAAGVTAAFDLNVLEVLNRRLAGDFDPADFQHVAVWDAENAWIEMRLRARRAVTVAVRRLDLEVTFAAGEEMRTEISAKFTRERLTGELTAAGLSPAGWWTDDDGLFSLSRWRR
jgi:L-histidine Nalpha-methyltransferase